MVMNGALYTLSSGLRITTFVSECDNLWYWHPICTSEDPVGPYPTEKSAILDAEMTEQMVDLTRPLKTKASAR